MPRPRPSCSTNSAARPISMRSRPCPMVRSRPPKSGWRRAYVLNKINPSLVSFEERHACGLIANSAEQIAAEQWSAEHDTDSEPRTRKEWPVLEEWYAILTWAWPILLEDAKTLTILSAQQAKGSAFRLCDGLGIPHLMHAKPTIEEQVAEAVEFIHTPRAEPASAPR